MGGKAVSWKIHRSSFLPLFYATCLKMPICTLNLSPEKRVDTFQDFLIAEHMKPCKHILEISIFSLNHVIVRPTKGRKSADKTCA